MLKISLDMDGVICDWYNPYLEKFGEPETDLEITRNVWKSRKDKDFWLNLPVIRMPDFNVHQYTTARVISKNMIKQYLRNNNFPEAPVYQVRGYYQSKAKQIKLGGADVHVDDSLTVFMDLNLKGIPCLLMDSPANQNWGPIARVYSLNKEEIEECYYLFMDTLFPCFKDLLYDTRRY